MHTLKLTIPKGFKTGDIREKEEDGELKIEVDIFPEERMCKIRQPHEGFDCKCNKVNN